MTESSIGDQSLESVRCTRTFGQSLEVVELRTLLLHRLPFNVFALTYACADSEEAFITSTKSPNAETKRISRFGYNQAFFRKMQ
jgi:hypothetical protein